MSRNTSRIRVSRTSDRVNDILSGAVIRQGGTAICHYNQSEDQFIVLPGTVFVPALPVHHAMDDYEPPPEYEGVVAELATALMTLAPSLIAGTTWFFDPVDIHTPKFYRTATVEGVPYLYLLLIDLTCRPLECKISEEGTNRRTHSFWTNRLYFECDWFPLADGAGDDLEIAQSIPFTWKGEAGQGYMVHGIWMDADINKFFSKLILPAGKRNYPYYPLTCKQHCVSMNAFGQDGPELLHRARASVEPALDSILEVLHAYPFTETLPLFQELKGKIAPELGARWESLAVTVSLNEREQKEYTVAF